VRLVLLHLSDLHFREASGQNPALARVEAIAAAVGSLDAEPDLLSVVVSGDIAFSGRRPEYEMAGEFLTGLSTALGARVGGAEISHMLLPGNHDCDFARQGRLREMLLNDVAGCVFDDEVLDACLEVQADFWDFAAQWDGGTPASNSRERVCQTRRLAGRGESVEFRLLNTALLSSRPERQGSLIFPVEFVGDGPTGDAEAPTVTVAVLHHPYDWLDSSNARAIRDALEASSDIILTGHEHETREFHVSGQHGEEVEYLEGAVFQDSAHVNASGFHAIYIDTDRGTQELHRFQWSHKEMRYSQPDGPSELPFVRNAHRLKGEYRFKKAYEQKLVDPEARFTHPAKESVTLDDIFVYPDLRILSTPLRDAADTELVRDGISGFLVKEGHVLVVGPDKSGKTTLAKQLVLDLRKRGLVPVMLSGAELKRPDEKAARRSSEAAFTAQYESPEPESYWQLSPSARAIVVDDSHLMRSHNGRDRIIREFERFADVVVLLGEDVSRFEDLLRPDASELRIWSYTACQILPLGRVKLWDLVTKWVLLGRGLAQDESELLRRAHDVERLVSSLLGRSLCPSYPLFVLVLLQQVEASTKQSFSMPSGSYAFMYESLLTNALAASSRLQVDLDTQFSYLSELAYALFSGRQRSVSRERMYELHTRFCDDYSLVLDFDGLVADFVAAGVLEEKSGELGFRYPYLYYYFVSRDLSARLNDEAVRAYITLMASRLHHEESANILLFLTYFSRDAFILDSILGAAAALFPKYKEFDAGADAAFLGPLLEGIPQLVLDSGDPIDRKRRMLAEQDRRDFGEDPEETGDLLPYEEIETDEALDDLLRINVAFKTIQILGQVLRNYPGSLRAPDKERIAASAFALGLRVLDFLMTALEENKEPVLEALLELIQERHPQWDLERIERKLGEAVVSLAEGACFVTTKQVADSVGDHRYARTYDDILKATSNCSYSLIDLCIRLLYFEHFPVEPVSRLDKKLEQSAFAARMLRHMVWYRFRVYPADRQLRQSVCDRLGIEVNPSLIPSDRQRALPPAD